MGAGSADFDVDDAVRPHNELTPLSVFQFESGVVRQSTIDRLSQLFLVTFSVNNQLAGGIGESKLDVHAVHAPSIILQRPAEEARFSTRAPAL